MNLNSLFIPQSELDHHIIEEHNLQGKDLTKKKTVALLTELYECINEARFFKFWSKDQKARMTANCWNCHGQGEGHFSGHEWTGHKEECIECGGTGIDKNKNPLLEEYADTIHFAISIANDIGFKQINNRSNQFNHSITRITLTRSNVARIQFNH